MQLFGDLCVDGVYSLPLRDLKDASAGLTAQPLEDLLAIDGVRLRPSASSTATIASTAARPAPASPWVATPTGIASTAGKTTTMMASRIPWAVIAMRLLALEVDRVNDRIGALSCLDRLGNRLLAVAVDAIGKQNERAAPLLPGGYLV